MYTCPCTYNIVYRNWTHSYSFCPNEIISFNYFSITHLYIILLLQLNGSFVSHTHTHTHTRTTYIRPVALSFTICCHLHLSCLFSCFVHLGVNRFEDDTFFALHIRFREPLYNLRRILRKSRMRRTKYYKLYTWHFMHSVDLAKQQKKNHLRGFKIHVLNWIKNRIGDEKWDYK